MPPVRPFMIKLSTKGAFTRLLENLYPLAASGAVIELRTVVTALNVLNASIGAVYIHSCTFYFLLGHHGNGAGGLC